MKLEVRTNFGINQLLGPLRLNFTGSFNLNFQHVALLIIVNLPFFQMGKKIKDKFRNHLEVLIGRLAKAGPTGPLGPELGNK